MAKRTLDENFFITTAWQNLTTMVKIGKCITQQNNENPTAYPASWIIALMMQWAESNSIVLAILYLILNTWNNSYHRRIGFTFTNEVIGTVLVTLYIRYW